MIGSNFNYESSLQYRIKALQRELESFKTGEKYVKMKEAHRKETDGLRREIKRLKEELARARKDTRNAINTWFETCEDIINEENQKVTKAKRQAEAMKQKYFDAEMRRHEEKAALLEEYERKLSEKEAVIEELKNRLAHADALLNRDGTNTGLPTALTPIRKNKVIPNSRRGTGKKKGGQKGHKKHVLEAPAEEYVDEVADHAVDPSAERCPVCGGSEFTYTGRTVDKYDTDVEIIVHRKKHIFHVYRCNSCGTEVISSLGPDLRAEHQYGPNVQALALSLTNTVNAAMNKVPMFLSAITGGQVRPCEAYVAKLQKKASKKLVSFKKDLRLMLLQLHVLYWDDTVIPILTRRACLRFYGDDRISYYTAHSSKGLEGILADNILNCLTSENYVMHDHNKLNYNSAFHYKNLECCQHAERNVQKSYDDTGCGDLLKAKELIARAIKDRNDLSARGVTSFSKEETDRFDADLEALLSGAESEVNKHPSTYGSNDALNLIRMLREYHDNFFAWMHDFTLPHTNNVSERGLRIVKTKKKVSGQFESEETARYYADIQTYTGTCRKNGINEVDALVRLMAGNPVTVEEIFPEFREIAGDA